MPGFIRVRSAKGPKHEFHAPADFVAAHPERYYVIDKTVVDRSEPPKYIVPESRGAKTVGDSTKENN